MSLMERGMSVLARALTAAQVERFVRSLDASPGSRN